MKRLMIFLLLVAASTWATPPTSILDRPDVVKSIAQIRHDAFGPLHIEYVLLVRQDSTDFVAGSDDNVQFKPDATVLAIIHTHPDDGYERPSTQDRQMAVKMNIPVYVVSRSEIWAAWPNNEISCVSHGKMGN